MKERSAPSPSIVVGIDGSRSAVDAALWAVDEAVIRDIPLRLLYAIEPRQPPSAGKAARDLATAEIAVRTAYIAVESLEQPVKIEIEIVQDRAIHALVNASRAATMLCVGGLGLERSTDRHYGSVAAAVSRSGHCPVAIIQRHGPVRAAGGGWVVAQLDEWPDNSKVLEQSVREARLRRCALRVLTRRHPRNAESSQAEKSTVAVKRTSANLDKQLSWWRRRYPDLDIAKVPVDDNPTDYLARNAGSIRLCVAGRRTGITATEGAEAHKALHDLKSSLLICEGRSAL
ncbi:MAG: universal stress protein [Mycobacterium sp.]